MSNPVQEAKDRRAVSPKAAREQAAAYFGFAASDEILIGDEVFEIPNPGLMDDDQQERYNELQDKLEETCDHDEDLIIPARTLDDGTVIPEETIPGKVKQPYTIGGKSLKPAYNVQLATALFGESGYTKFKAGGGRSNQVALAWARMQREFQAKVDADSKSEGGVSDSSSVSD